jgi:hypothetical protein
VGDKCRKTFISEVEEAPTKARDSLAHGLMPVEERPVRPSVPGFSLSDVPGAPSFAKKAGLCFSASQQRVGDNCRRSFAVFIFSILRKTLSSCHGSMLGLIPSLCDLPTGPSQARVFSKCDQRYYLERNTRIAAGTFLNPTLSPGAPSFCDEGDFSSEQKGGR